MTGDLIEPYKGYTRIYIIGKFGDKWEVEICATGKHLFVYSDEFEFDEI